MAVSTGTIASPRRAPSSPASMAAQGASAPPAPGLIWRSIAQEPELVSSTRGRARAEMAFCRAPCRPGDTHSPGVGSACTNAVAPPPSWPETTVDTAVGPPGGPETRRRRRPPPPWGAGDHRCRPVGADRRVCRPQAPGRRAPSSLAGLRAVFRLVLISLGTGEERLRGPG